jgi:hypothetical protein
MRFYGAVVILTIAGVMLVSDGVAPVGPEPAGASLRPEVQRRVIEVIEDRDRDAALGLLLILGMSEGRRSR